MGATAVRDDRAAIEQYLDMVERIYFRHRHVAAPPIAAACLWASSAAAWWLTGRWALDRWPTWLYLFALVMWLGVVAPGIVYKTERVPLVGPDRPGERADEPRVWNTKVVSAFGWGYAAVWGGVQVWFGPTNHTLEALAVFLVPAWVYWSHARTIRRGVEVFRNIERWDGEAVGLPGLEMHVPGAKGAEDGSWWEAPLKSTVKGRYTAAVIRKLIPRMAARYEVDESELEIVQDKPGKFVFRYTRTDPHEPVLAFEPPSADYSIRQRARVGRWDDDKSPMLVSLYRDDHGGVDGLALGQKGAGKSTYEEITAAYVAAAKDALLWLIDLKPGAQQWSAWAPVADWLATTPQEADRLAWALLTLMQVRGGVGGRIVKPTVKRPAIIVVLDEGALYFNPAVPSGGPEQMVARRALASRISAVESLLATSRSFAIAWRVALQRAIWDNVGGATIRGHLVGGESAIFRTAKNEDARLAVDMTADEAEVMRTSKIPRGRPGTCFIQNADNEEPRRGRIFAFTEAQRDEIVAKYADRQPTLEPEAVAALGEVYANRQRQAPGGVAVAEPEDEALSLPRGSVAPRLGEDEALSSIWRACAAFEPNGGTVREVAGRAGRSEPTTRARLNQLVTLGAARKEGRRDRAARYLVLGDEAGLRERLLRDDSGDDG